ncbi:thioredoxin family protein [Bacillus cereus]|uniref:thioredoxin family protein n=1 Tax=Bacillus cereus TaxID=1396 RepID=UPI00397A75F2
MNKRWKIISLIVTIMILSISFFMIKSQSGVKAKQKNGPDDIISIKELDEKKYENDTYVYFFKPDCKFCKQANDDIYKAAKDTNVNLNRVDLSKKENKRLWDDHLIGGTPTIIHFNRGEEVERIEGAMPYETYKKFFKYRID